MVENIIIMNTAGLIEQECGISFEEMRMDHLWPISPFNRCDWEGEGQICLVHYVMQLYGNLRGNNLNTVSELFMWHDRCA